MKEKVINTIEELHALAEEILASCSPKSTAQVLALSGDLGAGKTAFTKELASLLGISYDITSPTFVIMKSYPIPAHSFFKTLVHIDAYRIESDDEMRVLGLAEILSEPTNLVCIEWPEKIQALIPKDAHTINISLVGTTRTITYGN
ncbi:tRNA (adenosine(37)-N6)-threonylcarbamoyltransferase complex ATPase subunit type 1 TsaE [Candidatus Kaiserbacteria bacterium]|nr:MAG: tRNA (adenosine(37)-N6)-threonylcarbamoyltransferase complex ATPase subunit type 1 TsaE [Candidatus Kaiserbacteria bacterium]